MRSPLNSYEIGEGLPVLMLHGWQTEGKIEEMDFEPIFSRMSGLRRIYVDLPGMGKSPMNNIKNLDDIFDELVRFINHRLRDKRFLIVGSSCGGYLARAVAHKYNDRVDGLLLRVPLIEPDDKNRDVDPFVPLVTSEGLMSSMSTIDRALVGEVLVQTPAYLKALKAKYTEIYLPAEEPAEEMTLGPIRADPKKYQLSFASDFEQIKFLAPTLIVCGRQDLSVGYRDSLRLLEVYPRSTYAVLDRGTHELPVDASGANVFGALVRDWVFRALEWRNLSST